MTLTNFPTWPVDGPPPLPPLFGLIAAAAAPAAGVRLVVDTAVGPVDENDIAPDSAGLEPGLYRGADGGIYIRQPDGSSNPIFVPENAGRERWLSGVAVYPYPSNVPEAWNACNHSGTKAFGTVPTPPEFAAITLSEAITCTSQAVPDQAAFRARAVTVLTATESFSLAREFMTGTKVLGPNASPFLADTHCTFPNGTVATKPNHGIQVLERVIGLTGRLGLIHCSPMLATALLGAGFALQDKSGVIRTINGNVVIPDGGYIDSSKPTLGPAPTSTQEWAYATGPVDIRRSEVFTTPDTLAQALDRGLGASNGRTNQITYRAERYYVADWDTALQAAVLIDRCGVDCNTSS